MKKNNNLITLFSQVGGNSQPEKQYLQVSETSFSQAVSYYTVLCADM
jgi:hypothetical protein